MNRECKPYSRSARSILAAVAIVATFRALASIEELAKHYNVESQRASMQPARIAQR